ncbi:MAG: F0F1 ATP synthase subunit delta [Gammaproteobacteria bacterium]|nr:F0F1 ATP synthase subunit delta [Gammaproteobacteria bacterium]
MTTASTIARPYAKAAFEYAKDERSEKAWGESLKELAVLFADKDMQALLLHPKCSQIELAEIMLASKGAEIEPKVQNFIRLLAENSRLGFMAEISLSFNEYVAESQHICHATLVSAMPVDAAMIETVKQALHKRLNQTIELETKIDENLLGGAMIIAGNLVIDGSVRGQLDRLAQELQK